VIPVHFAGQPCDMPSIHALGREYGFRIIEDASHAIGASYHGTKVGLCQHSDITVFSFHPVKIITTAEGGVATTNDPNLAERMVRHRSHGITSMPNRMRTRPADEIWNYQQIDLGFNYRMTDLQAALGLSQLGRLEQFVKIRRQIARSYDVALARLPIILPWQAPSTLSSYHLYPIRIRESLCGKTQRQVYDAFTAVGIAVNLHYIPVYRHPFYEAKGFRIGHCPEAERFHRETISLPMFPTLQEREQSTVIQAIERSLP